MLSGSRNLFRRTFSRTRRRRNIAVRTLRRSNPAFAAKIGKAKGGVSFLTAVGFVEDGAGDASERFSDESRRGPCGAARGTPLWEPSSAKLQLQVNQTNGLRPGERRARRRYLAWRCVMREVERTQADVKSLLSTVYYPQAVGTAILDTIV